MKITSMVALTVAALVLSAPAYSAEATVGATVDATTDAAASAAGTDATTTASTTADTNATANTNGSATVNAGATATAATSLTFDSNADGTVDAGELETANATLSSDQFDCEASGLEGVIQMTGSFDAAAFAAATNANVVVINDCDTAEISSALSSNGAVRGMIDSNAAAVAAVQARGFQADDVLGATVSGGTVTLYVATDAS